MQDLAVLTDEMTPLVDSIEVSASKTLHETQLANVQLRSANKSQKRKRTLMLGALLGALSAGLVATVVGVVLPKH